MFEKLKEFWSIYSKYFKEKKISIVCLSVLVMAVTVIDGFSPLIYGNTIDSISVKDMRTTVGLIFLSFLLAIFRSVIGSIEGKKTACITVAISNKIKKRLFEKIIKMQADKLDNYTKGELFNRLEDSCDSTVQFYIEISKSLIFIIINTVVPLIFIFNISSKLSILAIMVLPLMFLITLFFQKKINKIQSEFVKCRDRYTGYVYNSIETVEGIRAFQIEDIAVSGYKKWLSSIFNIFKKQQNIGVILKSLQDITIAGFNFAVLFMAARYIMSGSLTIGSLVSFCIYIEMLFTAIASIMTFSVSYQQNVINIERILDIEKAPSEINKSPEVIISEQIKKIEAKNLDFAYCNNRKVLKRLNVKIDNPGWYSIVGENGCGKSTFLKILEKFYNCEKNRFFINDYDICDIDYFSLRKQIAYAAKKDYLINGTIRDNLQIANIDLDDQDIEMALKKVGLYEFVQSLDSGIETVIGEGAIKLSSGQFQKLTLARIVLRKSSVILIDEVTSDLDAASEQEIISVIKELSKNKIVISIAHRSSFIIPSDMIFYMNDGCFLETGTHEELLSKCLIYKKMFSTLSN